jgi:hypothetical protein
MATPTTEVRRVPANGIDFADLEAGPKTGRSPSWDQMKRSRYMWYFQLPGIYETAISADDCAAIEKPLARPVAGPADRPRRHGPDPGRRQSPPSKQYRTARPRPVAPGHGREDE